MVTTPKNIGMGLALSLSLALPAYADPVIPSALDGNFAILNNGTVTFDGDSTIGSAGTTIGVGAVEYLVVGGGGGGGTSTQFNTAGSGGGGAGGMVTGMLSITQEQHTVTVGAGGSPGGSGNNHGFNGDDSIFGPITGLGGGGGAGGNMSGLDGGSGGGGRGNNTSGGAGLQPGSASGGFGNSGGTGAGDQGAGGGGGAGGPGASTTSNNGGNGGNGLSSDITGNSLFYAGGGGGGGRIEGTPGSGGNGGGGDGGNDNIEPTAGAANTGGGGGGGNNDQVGAPGGSGVVHIRYAGGGAVASGGSPSAIGGTPYTLHSYTSGSSNFNLPSGFDASTQHATISGNLSGNGGVTVAGPGTLVLSGDNTYVGATTVSSGILVVDGNHTGGGAYSVANGAAIGGGGTINSTLSLDAGANFWWDGSSTLSVADTNTISLHSSFDVDSLIGFDWTDIALGTYTLIANNSDFSNIGNWGFENRVSVGDDKYAYFSEGSLQLNVVPEPSASGLLGIGLLTIYGLRRRRCA